MNGNKNCENCAPWDIVPDQGMMLKAVFVLVWAGVSVLFVIVGLIQYFRG